jgi:DNA replication protein DnaC
MVMDEPQPIPFSETARQAVELARQTTPADERPRRPAVCWHWEEAKKQIGKRYVDCRIDNFQIQPGEFGQRQQSVVDQLRAYGLAMADAVPAGRNLILYGPPGTGKDHLTVGLTRRACALGFVVRWVRGCDLFSEARDGIDQQTRERDFVEQFTTPDVLVISDPVPVHGELTKAQSVLLYQIIDRRYRDLKPVWLTLNVASGQEAGQRIGEQTVDRLSDGGMVIPCEWPSYRRRKT